MARNYTNTASQAATTAFIDATATSIALTGYTGFPAAPFTAALARGTAEEEVVLVTSVSGSTVTVTRGYDATNAVSHAGATTFQHVVVAKDYTDSAVHQGASSGVHGLTGAVVGTTDVQTLTNKTLTTPTISAPTLTGAATGVDLALSGLLTVAGTTTLTGLLTANGGITVPTGKKVTITDAPTAGTDGVNKTYADARETAAKSYTDTRETSIKSYADGLDTARKTYVDDRTTTAGASRILHADWGDVTAFPAGKRGDTCRRTDLGNTQWQYDGANWQPATPIQGKIWRTLGTSGVLPQNADVVLQMGSTAARLSGGMTFDGYGGLSVPVDGLYDLSQCVYWTGSGAWYAATFLWRGRTGVADTAIAGSDLHLHAGTLDARSYVHSAQVPLKAATKLWGTVFLYTGGGADAKYRGDSEGPITTWLSARYVGPLNGASPI